MLKFYEQNVRLTTFSPNGCIKNTQLEAWKAALHKPVGDIVMLHPSFIYSLRCKQRGVSVIQHHFTSAFNKKTILSQCCETVGRFNNQLTFTMAGSAIMQRLALTPQVLGLNPVWGLSMAFASGVSEDFSFLPQSTNKHEVNWWP